MFSGSAMMPPKINRDREGPRFALFDCCYRHRIAIFGAVIAQILRSGRIIKLGVSHRLGG